jgi:arylsulfatase
LEEIAAVIRFTLPALLLAAAVAHAAPPKPNVLLILADDLGFSDLGCYGSEIETPNLDALAKNGLRFTNFTNTARCWPTRGAILTGYYAQQIRRDKLPGIESGNAGTRPAWAKLLPELLAGQGYQSYHSGKWHVDSLPLKTGFSRSYSLNDHDRHFGPKNHTKDDVKLPAVATGETYYSSTAIADYAIEHLKGHAKTHAASPFFSFVAFTAPHFPVQAPPAETAKFVERYLAGWDVLREARFKKMADLKLPGSLAAIERAVGPPYANPDQVKKLGPDEINRPFPWADLTPAQKKFQAQKMAVHAAMVHIMDREIGRIVDQLKDQKQFENTLIVFLSDNGASAEIMVRGDGHDPHAECGTGATFLSIGPGWSSLCNTPFRRHKTWVHEGGIATPFVAHWPAGIAAKNEIRTAPAHVVDVVPTVLELSGGSLAKEAPPSPGRSLVATFAKETPIDRPSLWWLHEGNKALRVGHFKIVMAAKDANPQWELYDLSTDRAETKNLAATMPDKVKELAAIWDAEYAEAIRRAKQP